MNRRSERKKISKKWRKKGIRKTHGEVEFGANSEGVIEYGVGDALLVRFNGCSESRNFEIT